MKERNVAGLGVSKGSFWIITSEEATYLGLPQKCG